MIGRSAWYKKQKNRDHGTSLEQEHGKGMMGSQKHPRGSNGKQELKTRAVLFLEQTPNGELARRVKELLVRLEQVLGFKLRVVERTGRSIQNQLPQASIWRGSPCDREHCVTCQQGGEDMPDCTRSSIVYESICSICNPGALEKGGIKEVKEGAPSIYVGESSRTIQERSQEHWTAAKRKDGTSHIHKHQKMVHGTEEPKFIFKVVSNHRSALNRQVKEAVRIRRRGGANNILNSKAEFNRCHIPRLVVEEEDQEVRKKREQREEQERKETLRILEQEDITWEERKKREQELKMKKRR